MSRYLARLKALLAENIPTRPSDRTDESPSVSFVSDPGRHVSGDERCEADAIEERGGLASDWVPAVYLEGWARLNCQRLASVVEAGWPQALDDGGRFLDEWGSEAANLGWRPGELFDATDGLIWHLAGQRVVYIGADRVDLRDGRVILRVETRGQRGSRSAL
jgi:hypothetical protein